MTLSLTAPDLLVARAKAGDLEALEALYRAFETPVYNLARRICRSAEDAEDVLQETFLEVVKSIRRYRGEGHLWAWIRQIAASKALMRLRREKLRAADEFQDEAMGGAGGAGVGTPPASVGARIDLERAFERLSATSRAVVWLHDVEGFTHEEIAERMGKTVSFSKSQLARAHARLRRLLAAGQEAT
jgi:RNA polymerase sigma-70 factor (ECF subfamily)